MNKVRLLTRAVGGVSDVMHVETQRGITVFVHEQGIKVDLPDAVEINPEMTVACIMKLTQAQWTYISTGPLFRCLFYMALNSSGIDNPPADVEELKYSDLGIRHISGCIILGCEAMMAGKPQIFLRNPETYLHPRVEQCIMGMFSAMMSLCGRSGDIIKNGEASDMSGAGSLLRKAMEVAGLSIAATGTDEEKAQQFIDDDKQVTLKWLAAKAAQKGMDTILVTIGDTKLTVANCIRNVEEGTSVGKKVIEAYFKMYGMTPHV